MFISVLCIVLLQCTAQLGTSVLKIVIFPSRIVQAVTHTVQGN